MSTVRRERTWELLLILLSIIFIFGLLPVYLGGHRLPL